MLTTAGSDYPKDVFLAMDTEVAVSGGDLVQPTTVAMEDALMEIAVYSRKRSCRY